MASEKTVLEIHLYAPCAMLGVTLENGQLPESPLLSELIGLLHEALKVSGGIRHGVGDGTVEADLEGPGGNMDLLVGILACRLAQRGFAVRVIEDPEPTDESEAL